MAAGRRRLSIRHLRGRGVLRDQFEEHRASTPLELFFDLTIVVAVGRSAAALHHQLAEGHVATGVVGFALTFFAVWLAWLNFTWFATAHDSDDVAYRLLTLGMIAGALVFAAGVNRAVVDDDFGLIVAGYVVMRVGLIGHWLRVARDVPSMRNRALRYAVGLAVLQVLWVAFLALPHAARLPVFAALAAAELMLPIVAERAVESPPFHAEHIEERYGLLTIIVLGESVLSATSGFQEALDNDGLTGPLLAVGLGGLVLAFCAWWLYFDHPGHLAPTRQTAFRWGYGHVVIFAALAALGADEHLAFDASAHQPHGSARTASLAVAIPAAAFLLGIALIIWINRHRVTDARILPKLVGAAVIVVAGATASVPVTVVASAIVYVVLAASMVLSGDSGTHGVEVDRAEGART